MMSMFVKRTTMFLVSLAWASLACNLQALPTQAPAQEPANTQPSTMEFPAQLTIDPSAVPPSDVLQQIDFMVPMSAIFSCTTGPTAVSDPVSIGDPVKWCFCEIQDKEAYTVKLLDPSGVVVQQKELTAYIDSFRPCTESLFSRNLLLPGVPLGVYTLELIGPSSTVSLPFMLLPAQRPSLLETPTGRILAGFQPGETIRILAYKDIPGDWRHKFVGEWWFQANQEGLLTLEIEPGIELYAIGVNSGEAAPMTAGGEDSFSMRWINYMGPLDDYALVEALQELPIYDRPSNQNPAVANLPLGARLHITGGTISNNGTFLWPVESETGMRGWADERLLKLVNYEPNDTREQATDLFEFSTGPYLYQFSKLSIEPADHDFYRVQLTARPISIYISAPDGRSTSAPLGIALYDDRGAILDEKATSGSDFYSLSLYLPVPSDGTYYVEVYDNGVSQPVDYTLSIY